MAGDAVDDCWLVVSVSTAGAAASLRVQVWRKLRSLGALYLQQSVCLLPARPEVVREVRRLVDRVQRQGGSARVLRMAFTDPAEEQAVIAELNAARDAEYAEVLERLPELRKELAEEQARGNVTYAEVEESEADLDRFRTWLAKIAARDYFTAPGGQAARDAVEQAAAELAAFEDAALQAEAPEPHQTATSTPTDAAAGEGPWLRAVEQP
ncbi:Chromate resistance protein ChrB [Actinophytocola sp.]|uniref:Chromate resistance protein ChrB n=1 Tax=Actinophytocola sp. TaxID=1872138 RepID=UPI00389A2AF1